MSKAVVPLAMVNAETHGEMMMARRRQIATIGTAPIELWHDQPARDTWLNIMQRDAANELAAAEGMTVAEDQKPHDMVPVFGRYIAETVGPRGELMQSFAECAEHEATVVKVRACWWAT